MDISTQMPLIPDDPAFAAGQGGAEHPAAARTSASPALPSANHAFTVEPVNIRSLQAEHRRADAMLWVKPSDLYVVPGFNVRVRDESYLAHIRDLADSIKVDGFHIDKPISVVATRNEQGREVLAIVNGHSRHEAVLQAISEGVAIEAVPVIVQSKAFNSTDMTVELVKSNSGRPLSAYERAIVVKRLVGQGLSEAEIGRRLGFTRSYINGLVLLAGAAPRLVQAIGAGEVAATVVIEQIREHGHAAAERRIGDMIRSCKESGSKVTRSAMRASRLSQAVRASAQELFEIATAITRDPGFEHLSEANRLNLAALLQDLQSTREPGA